VIEGVSDEVVSIIDMTGREVMRMVVESDNSTFFISDLKPGVYFVVSGNNRKRLIKE